MNAQDSLTDQLSRAAAAADRSGDYDAADWIRVWGGRLHHRTLPAGFRADTNWLLHSLVRDAAKPPPRGIDSTRYRTQLVDNVLASIFSLLGNPEEL